jgi:hypothetical protein
VSQRVTGISVPPDEPGVALREKRFGRLSFAARVAIAQENTATGGQTAATSRSEP